MSLYAMIDIEAMGGPPDGAILSIGAIRFNPSERLIYYNDAFYKTVELASSVQLGLKIDADTAVWWMKQSDEAREAVTGGGWSITRVLWRLADWLEAKPVQGVAAHGASYDLTILETAYKLWRFPVPWKYHQVRDTRWLFEIAGIQYKGTAHHALRDVIDQAKAVIQAYDVLGNRKEGEPL